MSTQTEPNLDELLRRWQKTSAERDPALAEELLGELLLRWQEGRGNGVTTTALCARCPELAAELERRAAAIAAMEARMDVAPTREDGPGTLPLGPAANGIHRVDVPGFEILQELGAGGAGVVYQARQLRPSRLVAIKMLRSGRHARSQEMARFHVESEALGELQHPNIVPVYQVGLADGLPYFAMEYLDGGSLAGRLRSGRLPPREAARLVETLARAMHAAHQKGIIHRDLKPGNVLLAADGTPKISDFGLAKRLQSGSDLTPSEAVLGTLCYMAPEQAEGRTRAVGTLTDVYGLGAILYECLTGRPPFQGESDAQMLHQVLDHEVTPPRRLEPSIDADLETICLKCLDKNPARRYVSALALAEDLGRYLRGEPIEARPARAVERLLKWARRRPALAALAPVSGIALLALVGVAVSWFYSDELKESARIAEMERGTAEQQKQLADQQKQRAELAEARGRRFLYAAQVKLAHRFWHDGNVVAMSGLLERQDNDLRDFEWYYLGDVAARAQQSVFGRHDGAVSALAVSADGATVASGGEDGRVRLWDAVTLKERDEPLPIVGPVSALCFLPDGRLVWGTDNGKLVAWTRADKHLATLNADRDAVAALAASPDGKWLISTHRGEYGDRVRVWRVADDTVTLALTRENVPALGVAFDAKSSQYFLAGGAGSSRSKPAEKVGSGKKKPSGLGDGEVFVGRLPPDAGPTFLVRDQRLIHAVAVHPKGGLLATAGFDHTVKVWDLNTRQVRFTFRGHAVEVLDVGFSPDGKYVVSAGWDNTVRVGDVTTGQEVYVFRGHTSVVMRTAFDPVPSAKRGGPRIFSAGQDGTVRVWPLQSDQGALVLRPVNLEELRHLYPGGFTGVAVSPDGKLLGAAGDNGQLRLWDAVTLQSVRDQPWLAGSEPLLSVAFTADSKHVAAGTADGRVIVWDCATGKTVRLADLARIAGPVTGLAFSSDGKVLAVAAGEAEGAGTKVSPGKTPEIGGAGHVRLLDARTGRLLRTLQAPAEVHALTFRADGAWLAAACDNGTVQLWEVATGKPLTTFRGHGSYPVLAVGFSPDGRWVASGGRDGVVRVWEVESGKEIYKLQGHACFISGVSFSPDGKRLASSSEDWNVKLWDVGPGGAGEETLSLAGHGDVVHAVVFSRDGRRLYSAGKDWSVRVWQAPP